MASPVSRMQRWRRRTLQRRAEPETIYGLDHLRDRDLRRIEGHDRLLRLEAHVCSTHAFQPFQGLLDRDGSGASRHAVDPEDDRGGCSRRDVHSNQ